jgi:outer membrane protein insertion porin family
MPPVVEGRIEKIRIEGNKRLSSRDIRNALGANIKEGDRLSIDKDDPRKDHWLDPIQVLLADRGYLRGNVHLDIRALPPGKAPEPQYDVVVTVEEGAQYRIGEFKIRGNKLFTADDIVNTMGLRPGDVYNDADVGRGVGNLSAAYRTFGFINLSLRRGRQVSPFANTVTVTLDIEEGNPYRVGRIEVKGNDIATEEAIRREILLKEGEIFNARSADLTVEKLNRTYGKKGKARLLVKSDPRTDTVDVTFEVAEAK